LEWEFGRQGDIHLLEAALPLVEGLSISVGDPAGVINESAERFRLLARLMVHHGKPLRWRIAAQTESEAGPRSTGTARDPGPIARFLSDLCREEGLNTVGFICDRGPHWITRVRSLARALEGKPDLIFLEVSGYGPEGPLLAGSVLNDGVGDAICLVDTWADTARWPEGALPWNERPTESGFVILQACRLRLTTAEFIACPSCGRTQFDLQSTTARIRARTGHLRGVKIAIMGCIVNGPGEMADADYGYVGSGAGKVDLYVGRERILQGIPEKQATDRLVQLIRDRGSWIEPPP
jgi:(E)-4-hydroxy-3-methylbut-2-enyl-diphosphate synthase